MDDPKIQLPRPGDVLAEKYRVDTVVGEGGFGVVFLGSTVATGRRVAIKLLKPAAMAAPNAHERFLHEMRVVAQLQCPHTVTLYDFGTTDGGASFMVYEYVDGRDLKDLSVERGQLPEADALHILEQVLLSLAEAHQLGVLHRDIKPSNIRIYEYEDDPLRAKVLDFGLAKSWRDNDSGLTATGRVIGTPRYMSPEHLEGRELTPASDIFSLGLVAAEMLLGSDVTKLETRPAELRLSAADGVRRATAEVINKMLVRSTAERFSTAQEVLNALRAVEVSPPTRPPRRREPGRVSEPGSTESPATVLELEEERPRGLAFAAGLLVVLAIATAAWLGSADQEPPEPAKPGPLPAALTQTPKATTPPDVGVKRVRDAAPPATKDDGTDCVGLDPYPPGPTVIRSMAGLTRSDVLVYIPEGYDPTRQHSVVLVLGDQGVKRKHTLGMVTRDADPMPGNFVLVAPRIPFMRRHFDISKIREELATAADALCVDLDRVHVLGIGAGGTPGLMYLCEYGARSIATTGWRFDEFDDACDREKLAPLLEFVGESDAGAPIEGGANCVGWPTLPLVRHQAILREAFGCSGSAELGPRAKDSSACSTWTCQLPYESCTVPLGRRWPGSPTSSGRCGSTPSEYDYRTRIWEFFTEHDVDAPLDADR